MQFGLPFTILQTCYDVLVESALVTVARCVCLASIMSLRISQLRVQVTVYHWTLQKENQTKHVILSSERILSMFEKPKPLYSCIHICETCFDRKMRVHASKGKTWNKQLKEHKSISAHCLFQYLRNGSTVNRQLVCPQMEEKKMCYLVRLVNSRLISLSFF